MTMKPVGKLDNKERIAREELNYEWVVKYNDGTELKQYDDEKELAYHFGHIDPKRVVEFILESKTSPKFTISVNLKTGLFYINGKLVEKILVDGIQIPLGFSIINSKKIVSPWGNKAKLLFYRHVQRHFNMGLGTMNVEITYEFGWEARVDGRSQKHTVVVDRRGHLGIPITPEQEGFKAL